VSAGPEESFDDFAVFAIPRLRQLAFAWRRDWNDADDAVQGALERVFAAWPRVRKGDAYGYTRTTLVRLLISEGRRGWRRHEFSGEPGDPEPSAIATDGEWGIDLGRALAALPQRQRAVVLLRYVEDLSVAQTAQILGCSEGTVKSQAHVGRQALKTWLTERAAPPQPAPRPSPGPTSRHPRPAGTPEPRQVSP
jgi:RNA polymerase sigma-70 factor (sigma-E family)